MQITKNTTDLKIGSILKAIHIEDDAPFELNKFYKITDGDCVGTFKIGNATAFAYSINELGDYFEHIASLDDIEDLEKKASILKETFEQIKNMSNDENVYVFTDDSIEQETIAFLVQDEVFKGDEIELQFICDNMDISMVEKCSCCGAILLPNDEAYEDSLNDGASLCDHCSAYDEDSQMYVKAVKQDVVEKITGLKFSHLVGNVGTVVENFNNWLNENKYGFGIFDDLSKASFVEFLTEQTELNICDICGQIEKTEDLNWSDENLFDEDYQNFRFLEGTNIGFDSICDDCLNKVGTISQPSLEDITTRIQENQMMHKVFDLVLLENVNFEERNIKQTTIVGEICYMDFDKKTYKLKEFGEHEFKDEDFFDILNLAYVNEYVEFIAEKYPEKSDEVDEWSYPNCEGHADIEMAFENFGYKDEFIDYLKENNLPYKKFINQSPVEKIDEALIVKNDIMQYLFCQDDSNGIVVPSYNELIAASEIQSNWQLEEEYQFSPIYTIKNIVDEKCEEFFARLKVLESQKEEYINSKRYKKKSIAMYGVSFEIMNVLQELNEYNTLYRNQEHMVIMQASQSTQDYSTIEIITEDDNIKYDELEEYLKQRVDNEFHDEIDELIETIKEAVADKEQYLHLFDN